MSDDFDPYREWLGIKAPARPLNCYQLLDLRDFEEDPQRIDNAEMIEVSKVLRHETGPHAARAQQLIEELELAVSTLSDPDRKAAYDAQLRLQQQACAAGPTASRPDGSGPAVCVTPEPPEHDFSADLKLDEADEDSLDLIRSEIGKADSAADASAMESGATLDGPSSQTHEAPQKKEKRSDAFYNPPGPDDVAVFRRRLVPTLPLKPLLACAATIVLAFSLARAVPQLWNSAPDPGPILARLKDPEPQARIDAIDAFRYLDLDRQESTRHLLRVLKEDNDNAVRVAAANGLLTIGPVPELVSELQQLATTEKHTGIKNTLTWIVEQSQPRQR